jgi:hypothetical protein
MHGPEKVVSILPGNMAEIQILSTQQTYGIRNFIWTAVCSNKSYLLCKYMQSLRPLDLD